MMVLVVNGGYYVAVNWGVPVVSLLFEVYTGAPDFRKLPYHVIYWKSM